MRVQSFVAHPVRVALCEMCANSAVRIFDHRRVGIATSLCNPRHSAPGPSNDDAPTAFVPRVADVDIRRRCTLVIVIW